MSTALEKSLDDIIGERQPERRRGSSRREPRGRRDPYSRPPRRRDNFDDAEDRAPDRARWSHDRYSPKRGRAGDDYESRDRPVQLKVSNIHYDLTEGEIRDLFEKIARVTRFKMLFDKSGRSEGICFVTYSRYGEAKQAIREYDGQLALGQRLEVEIDEAPREPSGRDLASRISAPMDRRPTGPARGSQSSRGRGRGRPTSTKRGPVSAADLDAELDSFMSQRNDGEQQKSGQNGDANADGMQID